MLYGYVKPHSPLWYYPNRFYPRENFETRYLIGARRDSSNHTWHLPLLQMTPKNVPPKPSRVPSIRSHTSSGNFSKNSEFSSELNPSSSACSNGGISVGGNPQPAEIETTRFMQSVRWYHDVYVERIYHYRMNMSCLMATVRPLVTTVYYCTTVN